MTFILLTHSREVSKKTNTGQLVQKVLPDTQTIIWQRLEPDESLLQLIAAGKTALVYPVQDSESSHEPQHFENFILIDSTWQEARKIFNRSEYLQHLPRIQLSMEQNSKYHLRRNQIAGGLCTAECAIELLKITAQSKQADDLSQLLNEFLSGA